MATLTMTQPRIPNANNQEQNTAMPAATHVQPQGFNQVQPQNTTQPGGFPAPPRGFPGTFAGGPKPVAPELQDPTREASPFMQQFGEQLKILDPEQREMFVQNALQGVQSRLARYNYRLSRGRQLDPNQQQEYDSLLQSLGDIQDYSYSLQAIPSQDDPTKVQGFQFPGYGNMTTENIPLETPVDQFAQPDLLVSQSGVPEISPGQITQEQYYKLGGLTPLARR